LRRASASIVLNIAEGAAEFRPREKARFYRMALRSASEAAATLDLLRRSFPQHTEGVAGRELIVEIVSMLKRLVISTTNRKTPRVADETPR
jgi:four helix bundle protein